MPSELRRTALAALFTSTSGLCTITFMEPQKFGYAHHFLVYILCLAYNGLDTISTTPDSRDFYSTSVPLFHTMHAFV